MKLAYMIMLLVLVQGSILLFDGLIPSDSYTLDPYNSTTYINNTENVVWDFVTNPSGWESSGLLTILAAVVGITGAVSVGVYLYTKSDTILLFGVFTALLGFGAIPIISLYNVMNRNPAMWGCTSIPCPISIFFWAITGGLLSIFYVLACLEWWTGRTTS